ncbi:hypothetical protein BCV69DRAFT_275565 [Microstroma glucosiphilum]|uniref:Altered inheritance of mitochondria protein 5, mitochondrial n=1 Tax=Pseudomicrostroma glucosiphilum TaxID=1684307 RepID=A0A316UJZ9_9BASI|nr:hypothetical protein BCV69DRAFT_275565 [Pseudomicrostroma glucosiphilum]PWN24293.1 hypothetical protein BCV69DRAFT_275565 [Pseudomicrostroma glucosiphilum]
MSFARLAVPPVAGAATSLALLYLYHQATLSRHDALQDAIEQTRESVENAEHRIRDKFSGKPSSGGLRGEEGRAESSFTLGERSRYQEKRYKSVAEEIKERWNYHLLHLPSTFSHLEADNIILTTFATLTNYTRAAASSLSDSTTSSSSSNSGSVGGAVENARARAGDALDRLEGASLRTEEEVKRKAQQVKEGIERQEARLR